MNASCKGTCIGRKRKAVSSHRVCRSLQNASGIHRRSAAVGECRVRRAGTVGTPAPVRRAASAIADMRSIRTPSCSRAVRTELTLCAHNEDVSTVVQQHQWAFANSACLEVSCNARREDRSAIDRHPCR